MKFSIKIIFPVFLILILTAAFTWPAEKETKSKPELQEIHWISFEEAMLLSQKQQKKVIIDIYTDWCGWCKKMDVATFQHPVIAKYVSEFYYPVRFDAEQKADIVVGNKTYKFVPGGRNGYHELAFELMGGKMSYPTIVFLDDNFNLIQAMPGYRGPQDMEPIVQFFGSNAYKTTAWDVFSKNFKTAIAP